MVANIRCAEIAADQLAALQADQAWLSLKHEAEGGLLPGFGARVGGLMDSNLGGGTLVHLKQDFLITNCNRETL